MKPSLKITGVIGVVILLVGAVGLLKLRFSQSPEPMVPQPSSESRETRATVQSVTEVATPKGARAEAPAGRRERHLSLAVNGDQSTNGATQQGQSSAALPQDPMLLVRSHTTPLNKRIVAVHRLGTALSQDEVSPLYAYLRTPSSLAGQDLEREDWLRNEIMDKLVAQRSVPEGLANLLEAIYQDHTQDIVMRDYALQHMVPVYERVSAVQQALLRGALWQATDETDSSVAGTALLGLLSIGQADSLVDGERLANTALKLAADDRCGELTRITAVQVCGRMGVRQSLPVVEQLTQQSPSISLRIAATAALGDYAINVGKGESAEAANLLKRIAESSDPRQGLAAESALRRITRASSTLAQRRGQ